MCTCTKVAPNEHFYNMNVGPKLEPEDVIGFLKVECMMMGMECVLLETVRYGMTFLLFHLQDIEGKK